ncbi:MAG TPA: xanthine dehydrogenase family protein subunit M [Kofleriaceae bacterium]|jgi:xanthine dehydrogenase YagS FAD-binding subunit
MNPFTYLRATDEAAAVSAGAAAKAAFLAGGTTIVDLMRLHVMQPDAIVDLGAIGLTQIENTADGGVRIGALVTNTALADHQTVGAKYPVVVEAIRSGASAQIRNVATTGGNLLQRTRCPYFRDAQVSACNKRAPGSGCAAIGGVNRSHAVLGVSNKCIATHPSDFAVALVALEASVRIRGAAGTRVIALEELHTKPGDHPEIEHTLKPGEVITHVEIPANAFAKKSHYLKIRDRASFAFALASAAVALDMQGATIRDARVALGGVGTVPWRAKETEAALRGKPATRATFVEAAKAALVSAKTQPTNAFKVELAQATIVRALEEIA